MCAFTFHMKKFAIMLLGVIFVVLLSGSVESVSADHLLPGEGVFKNENDVNIASSIDSKYQIYLHVVIRNAQDQLVSVSEAMHGKYIPHEITDTVFDEMPAKREIIIIDKIEYEKLLYTVTYDVQHFFPDKSSVYFLHTWTLEFNVNVKGHGLYKLPIFQAEVPLILAEDDILTFYYTILRELN